MGFFDKFDKDALLAQAMELAAKHPKEAAKAFEVLGKAQAKLEEAKADGTYDATVEAAKKLAEKFKKGPGNK